MDRKIGAPHPCETFHIGVSAVSRQALVSRRNSETLGFPLSRPNRDPVVRMASREDPKPLADCIAELLPNLTTAQETRLDILPNRLGTTCAHCGFQMRGSAEVDGQPVCHTGPPYPDCYRLVTVYREALGSRRPA